MNYYPHHIGDYASATAHLSMAEDGAYRRLMDWYYLDERPIPADKRLIYRRVRAITKAEREAVDAVLAEFFYLVDDGYRHRRCDAEIERAREKSGKARESAQQSVLARARNKRLQETRERGTHTQAEWLALLAFCGGRCVRCGAEDRICKDHIVPIYHGGSDAIENLQPLCQRCNSAKGPDATDHRPHGWQAAVAEANAQRTLSDRSANAQRTLSDRSANAQRTLSDRSANAQRTLSDRSANAQRSLSGRSADVQLPITNSQEPIANSQTSSLRSDVAHAHAHATAVDLAIELRKHGVECNSGDPRLERLAEQGTTPANVAAACEEARRARPGERIAPGYVVAILERWAKDAARINVEGLEDAGKPSGARIVEFAEQWGKGRATG